MDENDILAQILDLGVLEHQALQRMLDAPSASTCSLRRKIEPRAAMPLPNSAACFIDANFTYVESCKKDSHGGEGEGHEGVVCKRRRRQSAIEDKYFVGQISFNEPTKQSDFVE